MIPEGRATAEGPDLNELRIIGVELAMTPPNGAREVELDMFSCRHTVASPAADPVNPYMYRPRPMVRVTLHTSRGDVTLTGQLP